MNMSHKYPFSSVLAYKTWSLAVPRNAQLYCEYTSCSGNLGCKEQKLWLEGPYRHRSGQVCLEGSDGAMFGQVECRLTGTVTLQSKLKKDISYDPEIFQKKKKKKTPHQPRGACTKIHMPPDVWKREPEASQGLSEDKATAKQDVCTATLGRNSNTQGDRRYKRRGHTYTD